MKNRTVTQEYFLNAAELALLVKKRCARVEKFDEEDVEMLMLADKIWYEAEKKHDKIVARAEFLESGGSYRKG